MVELTMERYGQALVDQTAHEERPHNAIDVDASHGRDAGPAHRLAVGDDREGLQRRLGEPRMLSVEHEALDGVRIGRPGVVPPAVADPTDFRGLVSVDDNIDAIAREALEEARRKEAAERYLKNPGSVIPPTTPKRRSSRDSARSSGRNARARAGRSARPE